MSDEEVTFYFWRSQGQPNANDFLISSIAPRIANENSTTWKMIYSKSIFDTGVRNGNITPLQRANNYFLSAQQKTNLGSVYLAANQDTFQDLRIQFCIYTDTLYCNNQPLSFNGADPVYTMSMNKCSRMIGSGNAPFNQVSMTSNPVACDSLLKYLNINEPSSNIKDAVLARYSNFCDTNVDLLECQCYNRQKFRAFQDTRQILSGNNQQSMVNGNEVCWYTPCQYTRNIMMPTELQTSYDRVQCPNVCQNIVAAINVREANFNNIALSTNCGGSTVNNIQAQTTTGSSSPPQTIQMTPAPVVVDIRPNAPVDEKKFDSITVPPSSQKSSETRNGLSKTAMIIIIVSCVVGIPLIVAIGVFVARKYTKNPTPPIKPATQKVQQKT